jgi:hypothetical protein
MTAISTTTPPTTASMRPFIFGSSAACTSPSLTKARNIWVLAPGSCSFSVALFVFWSAMGQTLPAVPDRQHTAMADLTRLLPSVHTVSTLG